MSKRRYVVSVADTASGSLDALVGALQRAGLDVSARLDAIGIILGAADEASLPAIREVPGVMAVDDDRAVQPADTGE